MSSYIVLGKSRHEREADGDEAPYWPIYVEGVAVQRQHGTCGVEARSGQAEGGRRDGLVRAARSSFSVVGKEPSGSPSAW